MQNLIKKLGKALLFSRNQVFCLKNWKLWRAPTRMQCNNFVEILCTFSAKQCLQKDIWFFFIIIILDFELFAKLKKEKNGFYTLTETMFMNNPRSKQNKKPPNTLL